MNPQEPVGTHPSQEFTEEALDKKFSYSFTRRQLIILVNVLRPLQLPISDLRASILIGILSEIEATAIQSITASDYKPLPNGQADAPLAPEPPIEPTVQTN